MMRAEIIHGDMLTALPDLAACGFSCDAIITDPPYHLASIAKRFGKPGSAAAQHGRDGAAGRLSRGFMGSETDAGDISFRSETWIACADVLPPGGRIAVFGGTRTWWKTATAIDAAGFEIEDTIMWVYGQGLVLRQSRLKPCYEPIILARKPGPALNLNIDECRVARGTAIGGWPGNLIHDGSPEVLACLPDTPGQLADARTDGTSKNNRIYGEMKHRQGESVGARRLDNGSAARFFTCCPFTEEEQQQRLLYHAKAPQTQRMLHCNICGISFPSVDKKEHQHDRLLPDDNPDWSHLSGHPTVKPVSLMAHLVKLLVPTGGLVLDPFSGTGSTAVAALQTGRNAVGIEREHVHVDASLKRIRTVLNKAA